MLREVVGMARWGSARPRAERCNLPALGPCRKCWQAQGQSSRGPGAGSPVQAACGRSHMPCHPGNTTAGHGPSHLLLPPPHMAQGSETPQTLLPKSKGHRLLLQSPRADRVVQPAPGPPWGAQHKSADTHRTGPSISVFGCFCHSKDPQASWAFWQDREPRNPTWRAGCASP